MLVTFRWTPHDFHQKIERHSHKAIFAISLILATIPVFFEGYNPECSTCLPAPLPIWCGDWIFWGDGETECIRGSPTLSTTYYTIYLTNLTFMGLFCTGSMIQVYLSVRRQEDRNARYSSYQRNESHRTKSRRIRRTMILYTFGFYLCWVVPSFIIHFAEQGTPVIIMSYILLPFQGFFNMIIFLAPKCAKYVKDHKGTWLVTAYFHVIFDGSIRDMKRCCVWMCGKGTLEAIWSRSTHFSSPFRVQESQEDVPAMAITTETDDNDDDDLGFQGFNEEPQSTVSKPEETAGDGQEVTDDWDNQPLTEASARSQHSNISMVSQQQQQQSLEENENRVETKGSGETVVPVQRQKPATARLVDQTGVVKSIS